MKTRTLHKALSMLLTAAMVLNMGLTPVFAADGVTPPGISGVCTHHTEHTADCGYKEGATCTHEHTEDCSTKELTCDLAAGDAPEIATDSEATLDSGMAHTHKVNGGEADREYPLGGSEGCYTQTDNCKHEHSADCNYTPGTACTFDAASCTECNTGDKPAEKVCRCPPVDSGELVHGKDCPLYTAPALSEAVQALIALVDALPNAADITEDNREAVKPAFEAALTAYEALSDEDKAVFEATEQYAKLMALLDLQGLFENREFAYAAGAAGTSGWLEAGASYTKGSYDCIVFSSDANSAVVLCVDIQPYALDKAAAITTCSSNGGRLTTFDEFACIVIAKSLVNSQKNYYCYEYKRCWYDEYGLGHDNEIVIDPIGQDYFIAFDINRNPITPKEDFVSKKIYDASAFTVAADNFTWLGGGTPTIVYYVDENGTKTTTENSGAADEGSAPVNVGDYFIKLSTEAVTVDGVVYEPSDSGYIPIGILDGVPVKITAQPEPTSAVYGYSADTAPALSLTASPTNGISEVTYQWYSVGTGAGNTDEKISGATQASYTIPVGLDVGAYSYYCAATCIGYPLRSDTATVTITTANSALTLTTDKTDNTFTYGDTITFTANVSIPTTKTRAAAVNTVEFFCNGTSLGTANLTESGGTGSATFAYDTTGKKIPAGENIEITAEYGGSGNLNGQTASITVTLNPKPLTGGTITTGQSKPYDGSNSFSRIAATFAAANGVVGSDDVTATVNGTTSSSEASSSLPLTVTSYTPSGKDAGFYLFSGNPTKITGNVAITKIDPTITVETDKSSHLGGKEITVTVKITNPTGAASGFPAASEIAIAPTNATEKNALAQQGTTGVYTATYTLADYSAGLKAKFAATVPNATTNYNANTTGTTSDEVEILDKYTPTVTIAASDTRPTYGESITLTATVGKNGQTSPLAGTVQFKLGNANHASSVAIDADGKATLAVGKETLTAGSHGFKAEFIPASGSDYKGKTSASVEVLVKAATMDGEVTIDGTPKFGETLTANTSALSGLEGDALGTFQYEWFNSKNVTLGNETTYTIQEADIDGSISLEVIPANGNYDRKLSLSVKPTKADSTVTITGNPAKTYDGTAVSNPATTQTGSTGTVTFEWYNGSGATGTPLSSAPINAGSYSVKAILAATATHEGVIAAKNFVISKAPLAVTGYTAENKNYDGKRDATVSAVFFSGLQNGESLTLGTDYTTAASFADQNANNGIAVTGTVTLTTTATASNYSLARNTPLSGQTADIAAINPIYSVADQKITLNKTLTAIQAAGAATGVNSESVAGTLKWSETSGGAALADSYSFTGNAGNTKTLYWTFTPTGSNYKALSGSTVFTLTDKKVPVLTVPNIVEIYNGRAITTVNGTAKEDNIAVAGTFAFDGAPTMKNAGIYNATVKFTPNDTESYEIATTSITVTINKATVGIALNLSKDRITAGEALPTPSIAYSGLVSGESLTPATAPIFAGMPSGGTEGTYTITWSNKAAMQAEIEALPVYQNYTASYKDSVTLTIDKRSGGGDNPGGDGGSGGGSIIPPVTPEKPTPPITAESNVNSKTDKNGNATAVVAGKDITNAIDKAQKEAKKNGTEANGIAITLNVKTDKKATSLNVTLPQKSVTALIAEKVTSVTVKNDLSTVTLDLATLKALAGGDVILSVSKADTGKLSAEAKTAIAGRPVFQFGLTSGGKTVSDFKGGKAGLQIPYTPTANEQIGNLCGVYVEGNGKVNWLETSSYDSITGMMLISAQHFSTYGIGYKQSTPKFTDVGTHWAKNDIDFVVARGLLTGTSNTTFAPDQSITRGALQSALEKLSGKSMAAVVGGNATATVTRQEMAVMLVNYSKAIGYKLPGVHAEVNFTDANSIASWAKDAVKQTQMAGILTGKSGNRFDPTATATRAEVSAMLRRYVELVVNTETAEGWSMNESGQWMYIEDGKRVTGSKTIDGKAYTFDQYGVTTALPPERKYLTYTVQKGDSFWSIAQKYKVSMFELTKVNGKTVFSVVQPGEILQIPEK